MRRDVDVASKLDKLREEREKFKSYDPEYWYLDGYIQGLVDNDQRILKQREFALIENGKAYMMGLEDGEGDRGESGSL